MNGFPRVAAALLLTLAACSPDPPAAAPAQPPLAGARIGGPFTLTDQNGRSVSDRDFAGKYRIVYFGYTFCPDVCPVDVQNIGAALRLLEKSDPALAARVVPIFITVDPARDTPAVLKQFVSAFHPRMVGLTGSPQAIDAVAKEYAIFHQVGDKQPGGGYLVNHSRQAYLMGPEGEPLALLPQEGPLQAIAAEIRKWVK
ncbi:SCO family protein [Sphingomonas aracearum]|uniref:SCO family protein n=1 Tax=Sphingomonas aracearum TaxID=2283317 RepID=A0A369VTP4_9SPHN|nr:SCO family protein [Sphingomonas aracearum]RDE05015.1 SCO family protein [Sphingomonas aracearum]